jgi:hypothetical protein
MIELSFELLESKLRPPRTNGRGITRAALGEQLSQTGDALGYDVEAALEAS